jgi:ADP-ribose pyrophosphatase YjhB (NUDIX family)
MTQALRDQNGLTEAEFLSRYDPAAFGGFSVSADTVIFGVDAKPIAENHRKLDQQKLTVLLVKRTEHPYLDRWSLPGGFVGADESPQGAAMRVLRGKTGLSEIYLEQLGAFGEPSRDPRMRIVSIAYLSLIDRSRHALGAARQGAPTWFDVDFAADANALALTGGGATVTIPVVSKTVRNGRIAMRVRAARDPSPLAFDHADMILEGLLRLRGKIDYTDIAFNLTPERFTVSQLQQVYEILLGTPLLSPVFRRKIAGKIEGAGVYTHEKGHRPSQLFLYKGGGLPAAEPQSVKTGKEASS